MAGRPALPIGSHGRIGPGPKGATRISPDGKKPELWLATTRYRDVDGKTRKVKRTGRSKSGAENALRQAVSERRHVGGHQLTGDSRVSAAATRWFAQRRAAMEAGDLSPSTLSVYESAWRLYVEPSVADWRLREATVARCESWLMQLRTLKGYAATKSARTVLSGILAYSARMGAIPTNPIRDCSPIPGGRRTLPRALTAAERKQWLTAMRADVKAARWDIPDLCEFLLATGCRVGEALAVSWDEVDLDAGTVAIRWHLVPVTGEGLVRVSGAKSRAGDRVLRVPRWCVDMLLRRRVDEMSGYPVFPDRLGGWRWPTNTLRVLRQARDSAGFGWVTSHVFRKTTMTVLDEAGLSAREVADVAGHSDPSMTQRVYLGRGVASEAAAAALEDLL